MKQIIITMLMLSTSILFAQNTGVGTVVPTAKLDILGDLRVRTLPSVTNTNLYNIVLSNDNGNLSSVKATDFTSQLKIPNNIFNAQQNSSLTTALNGNNTFNRVVFTTVNLNNASYGSWSNNIYTVSKAGIYAITAGVMLEQFDAGTNMIMNIVSTNSQTVGGIAVSGSRYTINGSLVVVLAPGDTIYITTNTGANEQYSQGKAFLNIVCTPL